MLARDDVRTTYTVSQLSAAVRLLLEEHFPMVWVEGELSNLRVPSSRHWYFTLKDDRAQIRCAMFVNRNRSVRFEPQDGMQVMIRGRISLYEARGDFQLIADHIEPSGEGALRAAFEALKTKLATEGLFDLDRKRSLPEFPIHLAVISSATGAALHDILAVFQRRCPTLRITLLPSAVQGAEAESQLDASFDRLARWPEHLGPAPEAVILARGGGSLEDLQAFNSESLARRIGQCPVPVVAAIGHETDVTIADFAADLRAPTPSAGAELLAPDTRELDRTFTTLDRALRLNVRRTFTTARRNLIHLGQRLLDPRRQLQQQAQRIDDAEQALRRRQFGALRDKRRDLEYLTQRLQRVHPLDQLGMARPQLNTLRLRLEKGFSEQVQRARAKVSSVSRALNAVSPLDTLARGYAILATPDGSRWGRPITHTRQVDIGDELTAHLVDGRLSATVTQRDADNDV